MDIHVRRITEHFFQQENVSYHSQSSEEDSLVINSDINVQGTGNPPNTSFSATLANSPGLAQQTRVG